VLRKGTIVSAFERRRIQGFLKNSNRLLLNHFEGVAPFENFNAAWQAITHAAATGSGELPPILGNAPLIADSFKGGNLRPNPVTGKVEPQAAAGRKG
jgi:hypothetical protein